ncbi:MAG: helix-turn-helix domain-containing protein, partial [Planctomycetaceae bacterium]
MEDLVTPRQVAKAIDVSESSVKRWCDRGIIPSVKTAGGHRRIPISSVMTYLRSTSQPLVSPEVLGLPAAVGRTAWVLTRARDEVVKALLAGDESKTRQILFDLWLGGRSVALIGDDVIAPAFEKIGEGWSCSEVDIYQERRAIEIMLRILFELRLGTPPGDPGKLAIGGTTSGDNYSLPTTLVEVVLQAAGWTARSMGNSVPPQSFATAIEHTRPRLFWLSVSASQSADEFLHGLSLIEQACLATGTKLVVGGAGSMA